LLIPAIPGANSLTCESELKHISDWAVSNILITIEVSKMTKVTPQALYKKNIEIKEKKKKINESSDDF